MQNQAIVDLLIWAAEHEKASDRTTSAATVKYVAMIHVKR